MRPLHIISILICLTLCNCSENRKKNAESEKEKAVPCACIDGAFSSSKESPIANSQIGKNRVAFCGYKGEYYELDPVDTTSDNFGFKRTGFDIIQCVNDSVLFSVGEYYTDSVHIFGEGFQLYQLSHFPKAKDLEYESTTLLEFRFEESPDGIKIDTLIALPDKYFQEDYLNELADLVEFYKRDTTDTSKHYDLKLHYLFLRAVADKNFKAEFISSGPYDGYMGPIFNDFKSYLEFEKNKNGG